MKGLSALLMVAVLSCPLSFGHIIHVSGANLPSAIAAAHAGDTLLVMSGTYEGDLLLERRLTLIGVDKPLLKGTGKGSVITITADSCTVRGFRIEHCGTMLTNEDAGVLLKANHAVISGNDLNDILFGIYLFHAQHTSVSHNSIIGRKALELGERGAGIHIWNSNDNEFTGNTITDTRDGFYVQNGSHSLIRDNEAYNVRYGLHYMYADSNVFLFNRFHDNVAGAAVMYSRNIRLRHNEFSHNRGFSSFGILFQDCHDMVADSNVIADNVVGMFFEATTDNVFRHNVIAQNDIALRMFQNAINNTFTGNNFIDNLRPLTIVGRSTQTRWNENGRGNYWTHYDGYDLDGDGVGDVPMKIQNVFDYLEGQNENARLYLYSPAAQALAVAASTFPIMDVTREVDERPLFRPEDLTSIPAVRIMASPGTTGAGGNHAGSKAWIAFPVASATMMGLLYLRLSRREL